MESEAEILDDPIEVRKAKRQAILDGGGEAYAFRFDASAKAAALEAQYAELSDGEVTEDAVTIAGRIMAFRDQGKIAFLVIRDDTGDIQLFCRIDNLGEEAYEELKDLDVGDFIGAGGLVMRTRRGQLSIQLQTFQLLSKSLRPLPEKFHGLSDKEIRYRQRYVDLIMNPEVKEVFTSRFKIIDAMRKEAASRGFVEVETPMLHPIPGGATAKPFAAHYNALGRDFYMRVAPELHLKRLLVGGFDRVPALVHPVVDGQAVAAAGGGDELPGADGRGVGNGRGLKAAFNEGQVDQILRQALLPENGLHHGNVFGAPAEAARHEAARVVQKVIDVQQNLAVQLHGHAFLALVHPQGGHLLANHLPQLVFILRADAVRGPALLPAFPGHAQGLPPDGGLARPGAAAAGHEKHGRDKSGGNDIILSFMHGVVLDF